MATTTTSTTGAGAISSPGLGSGLDVNSIVTQLMAIEQKPLTDLQTKQTSLQTRISAFGSVKSALASFQNAFTGMTTMAGFQTLAASLGDSSAAAASIAGTATAGSYALNVTALAQAQKIASNGFASTGTAVGTGTLTFTFGTTVGSVFTADSTQPAQNVTIGASQNSLAGIRDAINAAQVGMTATIVNDGSANGQRLVLTSAKTGAASSVQISAGDDDGTATDASGLSQLAYDPAAAAGAGRNMMQTQAAQDAALTIDGLAITRPTNTISDVIPGVSLTLKSTTAAPTSLTVSANTGGVSTSVASFVAAYNGVVSTLTALTKYDASTKTASVLTGDSTVRLIQNQLRTLIGGSLGNGGRYDTLSQIGVSFQADGTLKLDGTVLQTALNTDSTAVAQLFAAAGTASDSLVTVSATTANTQQGNYAVNITQLATHGTLSGSVPAGLTITSGVNDTLSATVDGISTTITLNAGIYSSAAALAAAIQGKLNASTQFTADSVGVTIDGSSGTFAVTSNRYGSASNVAFSGNAADALFGTTPTSVSGIDVAGTIGGFAAAGSGQKLTGAAGTATDGFALIISDGALGARGSARYSEGMAARLNDAVTSLLGSDGVIKATTDGAQSQITDVGKQEVTVQARLDQIQQAYYAQYSALDTLISSLKTTSDYLTQQLAALPRANSINGGA
ncbi:MAG: flagellar filament capping protein FliD [Casimicrobiaceae bacterium]